MPNHAWQWVGIGTLAILIGGVVALFAFQEREAYNMPHQAEPPLSRYQQSPNALAPMSTMRLSSPAFEDGGFIPAKYTCDGEDINPPLRISGVPQEAQALVLIMDDPDAPMGVWDHWVVFNIPPDVVEIPEGMEPPGVPGRNSWGREGYGGPCPPDREHRYFFRVYALDAPLALPEGSTKSEVLAAMEGHILAEAQLMGRYDRQR